MDENMTEKKNNEDIIIVEEKNQEAENSNQTNILAASILFAAILISASLYYCTKLAISKFQGGQDAQNVPSQNIPAQNNPAQAPSPVDASKVNSRSGSPSMGKSGAKVTLMEFSDFQCPYCQRFFNDAFAQIKSKYIDTGKIKFVFRQFPLPGHINAQKAAEAAECANRQGKFWEYHNLLFKDGQSDGTGLATDDLKKYAASLGLNTGTFNACLDNGQATAAVSQDVKDGQAVGINGTPSFILNGKLIVGAQPFATFQQAIEDALK